MTDTVWYEPEDPMPREQCPCCDYFSLAERGSYLICPICFWEDDGQDLSEIDMMSGPNHGLTLRQGRENFRRIGASHPNVVSYVLTGELRSEFGFVPRLDQV
jgi:hypothetical protein